jgi:valyl-tRNA synthetase
MTQMLDKTYDPKEAEQKWYVFWQEKGYFRATVNPQKLPYCITIPPPNVTGELHMGHAIQHAIHDMVVRMKRMQGYETLCMPGTDHAGIATQIKVEEALAKEEGKTRYDVGREDLLERIWAWKEKYGNTIYDQLRQLGASYDWDRARFTLDEGYIAAVWEAFERFHKKDWIYRGTRMINWCPACRTVISDLETEERSLNGHLWHIRYKGVDGGPDVVVATTRPETMLGDTGVAVHPSDGRWQESVGKQVLVPIAERKIPIVADEYADPEMGSGAVKVTPAHDPNDYDVGQRHDLPQIQVIGFDGIMNEAAGDYVGQERYACRKALIQALEQSGHLVKVEDHEHAVPHHDKCGTVIEPLPMEQWFMRMQEIAAQTRPYLEREEIQYVPDRFRGYAIDWLDQIRDWALSRQIWWGHRVPAWYCVEHSKTGLIPLGGMPFEQAMEEGNFRVSVADGAQPVIGKTPPPHCDQCAGEKPCNWVQDPDVLDTWFSSGLWPFATLGWPEKTAELAYFHPTQLMITARDILYLWVLRMAMNSIECLGEIPFETVFVHPTVLTKDGRRMSKSLGTGLNPLDLVELYGTDATRFSLLQQAGAVQDVRFDAEIENNRVQASLSAETGRNFSNKLWNATRFALMNMDGYQAADQAPSSHALADRWIRSRLAQTIGHIDQHMAEYRFSDVTRSIYDFIWRDFCDWYLELAKPRLSGQDPQARLTAQQVLLEVLEQALRLMHPIMPFITESLWQALPVIPQKENDSIMVAPWPKADAAHQDAEAENQMQWLQEIVTGVRTIRGEMNIPPAKKVNIVLSCPTVEIAALLSGLADEVKTLAWAEHLEIGPNLPQPDASGSAIVREVGVYLPLAGLIDLGVERRRLEKEIIKFKGLLKSLDGKLGNEKFVAKAPAEVVEKERQRQEEYRANLEKLEASLAQLES